MGEPSQFEDGKDFERRFVKRYGGRLQPNSGATPFAKLDVGLSRLLCSLKHSREDRYVLTSEVLDEALLGARGTGCAPVVVVELAGRPVAIADLELFLGVLEQPDEYVITMSKAKARRLAAHGGGDVA